MSPRADERDTYVGKRRTCHADYKEDRGLETVIGLWEPVKNRDFPQNNYVKRVIHVKKKKL